MRFPLSMPALAAGALPDAARTPGLAVTLRAGVEARVAGAGDVAIGAFEENTWAADAMGSSLDLICPEQRDIFGQSVGKFLMRKDAFDLFWFPMTFDLTKAFNMVGKTKSQSQSKAAERQQD